MSSANHDSNSPVLTASHISAWYDERGSAAAIHRDKQQVLTDVSLDLFDHEVLAIIGGSGAGKTTLARILLGLRPPDEGTVSFEGVDIHADHEVARRLRNSSGIVFQDPFSSLDPRWRIERSVAEPLRLQHRDWNSERVREQVERALAQVGLNPHRYAERYPMDMSGGECQRAAIARAIVNQPRVLLADEPLSAIDMPTRIQVLDVLRHINSSGNGGDGDGGGNTADNQHNAIDNYATSNPVLPHDPPASDEQNGAASPGMSTIFVSHDLGVVQHLADHILVLKHGHVVELGTTKQVLHQPASDYTKMLLDAAAW